MVNNDRFMQMLYKNLIHRDRCQQVLLRFNYLNGGSG